MATLNTTIAVFAGHDLPKSGDAPEFFGTVGALRAESPDWLDGDTLQDCLDALDARGCWRYGGGAGQAFIALKVEPVPLRPGTASAAAPADPDAWPFREHRSQAEVAA